MNRVYPPSSAAVAPTGGGASGVDIYSDAGFIGTFTSLKFTGGNFTVTNVGGVAVVQVTGGGSGAGWPNYADFTAEDGQRFFPLTGLTSDPRQHQVVRAGVVQRYGATNDYTVDATGFTFVMASMHNENVLVYFA
jgi:hypothetical protein